MLGSDALPLDCLALVVHARDGVVFAELMRVLLLDIAECELDEHLLVGLVLEGVAHRLWIPNDIVNAARIALAIVIFSRVAEAQRHAHAHFLAVGD